MVIPSARRRPDPKARCRSTSTCRPAPAPHSHIDPGRVFCGRLYAARWGSVQKRAKRRTKGAAPTGRARGEPSPERLEVQREALLRRLARLHANAKQRPGYRTALNLLNPTFYRANLAARVAILQAANFMI